MTFSGLAHDFFRTWTCSWLVPNLLMTASQLVNYQFTTCSWFVQGLFKACSLIVTNLFINCSKLVPSLRQQQQLIGRQVASLAPLINTFYCFLVKKIWLKKLIGQKKIFFQNIVPKYCCLKKKLSKRNSWFEKKLSEILFWF